MLVKLKRLQDAAGVTDLAIGRQPFDENEGEFDKVGELAPSSGGTPPQQPMQTREPSGVERELLSLPSNGNVVGEAIEVEIRHRIMQARREVNRLRDIIADISFQYSNVIRGSVRKSVRTTAQKRVKSLHNELVLHARIYTRCRSRLIALNCEGRWLKVFRVLNRSDLRASTAILRPNIPGASSLQLSWLWQTGRWYLFNSHADAGPNAEPHVHTVAELNADADPDADVDPGSLLECL
jgi:hypothetical protein